MTIIGSIDTNQGQLYIQKNEQNNLKGLAWQVGGELIAGAVLALTTVTGAAALASLGVLASDHRRNEFAPFLAVLVPVSVGASYLSVKFTGYCFSNAIYHLGPEYQLAKAN